MDGDRIFIPDFIPGYDGSPPRDEPTGKVKRMLSGEFVIEHEFLDLRSFLGMSESERLNLETLMFRIGKRRLYDGTDYFLDKETCRIRFNINIIGEEIGISAEIEDGASR